MPTRFCIESANRVDIVHLMAMIRELAEFERLSSLLQCTEENLEQALFGPQPVVEALLGWVQESHEKRLPVAYAVFFHNFSTFLGKRGLYLEDLYVRPNHRHRGYAKAMLVHLARLAVERGCGRFEWSVLDWNTGAQEVYRRLGADILPDWRIARVTGRALMDLAGSNQDGR